jgi:AcrR family transcriptional regulator
MSSGAGEQGRYGRRRPRPGLTPELVVDAGRRLIERDGVEALTMRAVATELGTAAASLYRHVPDRDALLLAILEEVAAGLPVAVTGRTPQGRLRRRLLGFRDYMGQHAWVLHVLVAGELVATNALPFSEACVQDFRDAGLSLPRAASAYRTVYRFTLGEVLDTVPLRTPAQPTQRSAVMAAADPERFPLLAALARRAPDRVDRFPDALAALIDALC